MKIKLTKTSDYNFEMNTSVDNIEELMLLLGQFRTETTRFVISTDTCPVEIEIYNTWRE